MHKTKSSKIYRDWSSRWENWLVKISTKPKLRNKKMSVSSPLTLWTTTISMMWFRNIQWGRMLVNPIQLTSIFTINCVSLHTEGHISFCNYYVKIITKTARTLSEHNQARPDSTISSILQPNNSEICSLFSALRSKKSLFSCFSSCLKSHKYL